MRNIRVADRSEWVRDPEPGPPRRGRRQTIVDLIATIPTIVLVPALVLVLGPALAAGPTMTVSPGDSLAGQKVLVEGKGFARGEQGVLTFDGSADGMPAYRANGNGKFRVSLAVPSSAAPGSHRISARLGPDGAGNDRSVVTIVVDAATVEDPSQPPASPDPLEPSSAPPSSAPPTAAPTAPPTATPTSAPSTGPTAAPTVAPTQTNPGPPLSGVDLGARAYYYLWWSTAHWHDKLGSAYPYTASTLPLPATTDAGGCSATTLFAGNQLVDVADPLFTQDDRSVIDRDVQLAKSAGLTGFLLNWGGTGTATQTVSDSRYTQRFAAVLAASRSIGGFTNWLSYKTSSLPTVGAITNDAAFIFRTYGTDSAWGRIAGKPVFVLTGSRKYSTADLTVVSTALRPMFFLIGDESATTLSADRLALFDGLSYYWSSQNPYTNAGSFSQLKSIGDRVHAAGKPWLAPAAPGYNSELLRGGSCVPRNDGETLRRLWSGNSASNPNGWTLISWNEIAENTHVQPLTKWGNRYLEVLAGLIKG